MTKDKPSFWRDNWRLIKPYWVSDDKGAAWGLLLAVVALNLGSVFLSVRFNTWNRDFFDAIQAYNGAAFKHQFMIFGGLAAAAIAASVYQVYLQQLLQIRWRRWMTRRYLGAWLERHAYYRLQLLDGGTDNPDQRIADDLAMYTRQTLNLTLGLLSAGVTLVSFLGILWALSGAVTLPLGNLVSVTVPGYMVWFALSYAVVGTWLTVKIGKPLVTLNFDQQRYEANFRFSMMRLRENAESIALYGGEGRERRAFLDHFSYVFDNFRSIMKNMKRLNWYTSGYNQLAIVFPYLVAAPRYFSKQISFGVLQQTADAFGQVQQSLSFIVNAYASIAEWQSVAQRLARFDQRAHEVSAAEGASPLHIERAGQGLEVARLDVDLPDGSPLLRDVHFSVAAGEWMLMTAPSGTGKSTLLRSLAGIWPFGRGLVRMGEGKVLFLPQRPYIPLGTLRDALLYPHESSRPDELLCDVLRQTGLGALVGALDVADNWPQRLSMGEQQRLAFARVLLDEPAIIFMDEATSALDETDEEELHNVLKNAAWKPTVVSVGHRRSLEKYYGRVFPLGDCLANRSLS